MADDRLSPDLPLISKVDNMRWSTAHVELSSETVRAMDGPSIYAAFDRDGVCRYVGASWYGLRRPLDPTHHALRLRNWTRLCVWRLETNDPKEIAVLEREAIAALMPTENIGPCSPIGVKKKRRKLDDFLTTEDVADVLKVSRKFVVGEIQDGRLRAIVRTSDQGRTQYRIRVADYRLYLTMHWRPATLKERRAHIAMQESRQSNKPSTAA
jgi:excisionase family DNA binding protein